MNKTFVRTIAATALIGSASLGLAGLAHAEAFGDPDTATQYWTQQAYDDCAIMASADVIGQLTGTAPAEDVIVAYARNTPSVSQPGDMIYDMSVGDNDPNGGSIFKDLPIVLGHYGVNAKYVDGASLHAVERALGDGQAVIVNLNAETIWDESGDRTMSDHALVVTGVDTDRNIVHLNDSGTDDGADEQVSVQTFLAAWQTSGNEMIVTI